MSPRKLEKEFILRMVADLSKVSDKNVTQKILTKIRMELSKSPEGIKLFRECDGLQPLISFIKRPSKRILDLALSILGNCCTDAECVQEVMKLNIVPALLVILKTIPNQLILCRTCRLLGNLATDKKNAKCIQDGNVVTALVSVLDEETNEPGTVLMITRLVGKMWCLENFQVDAYLYGIIKRITLALVKFSEKKAMKMEEEIILPPNGEQCTTNDAFNPKQFQRESNQVHNSMENNHEQRSILAESFQRAAQSKPEGNRSLTDEFSLPTDSNGRDVITCMLKCILMAASSRSYQFSEQIIKTTGSLRCLLFYCTAAKPYREIALHIVSSLAYNPAVRYEIGGANGVDIIINLMKDETLTLTASEYKYCINIICRLAGDSCNRAKIRYCGGMRMLLRRFRDSESASEREMILYGLSIFANDQMSVHLLVREGLINTLLHRMAIELDAMNEYHAAVAIKEPETKSEEKSSAPKLKRKSSRAENGGGSKLKRANFDRLSPNGCYSDSMSSPSHSGYSSMSNRSPSYSSYSSPTNFDSDGDSATYSPVCSDAEEENGKVEVTKKEEDAIVELSGLYDEIPDETLEEDQILADDQQSVEDEAVFVLPAEEEEDAGSLEQGTTTGGDDDEEVESPEMKMWHKSVIKKMLVLLRDMRLRIRRVPDLARAENLSVLLRACKSIPEPVVYCQLILSFIVQDTENFVNLMHTNFIIDLYNLRHPTVEHDKCKLCADMRSISVQVLENVSAIAESGYGRGELAHYLLTGEKATRKHVAMVTSLVVRDPKFLYSLLFEHNALKIVMEEIMDEGKESRGEEACLGITALAMNLNLSLEGNQLKEAEEIDSDDGSEEKERKEENGEVEQRNKGGNVKLEDFTMKTESDSKITFKLSDGERIEFNEGILVSYSDVFNSMFSRDFQESKFKEVLISDVSAGGLKYFLQLVQHFHRNPAPRRFVHIPKTKQITVALEAYELSIKYMLGDIERNVLKHVNLLVDDLSVQDMLEWSMKNNNPDMLEMAIYYFLNSDLPGKRKLAMFRRANESVYSKEWNNWIVDTIKSRCSAALGLIAMTE